MNSVLKIRAAIPKRILQKRCFFISCFNFQKSSVPIVISDPFDDRASQVIDVRSPDEFRVDHIPGAVNLPVLKNKERTEVGILYKKDAFKARREGAVTVMKNIVTHMEEFFQDKPESFLPLIYCWRGGQRSYSMSLILAQIGFKTFVLEGGYKAYRARVLTDLQELPAKFQYRVITGLTGSGKTHILECMKSRGEQVLDLEGLAKHKGSLLGLWYKETQPTQKYFESLIRQNLSQFSEDKPVWLESESIKIGSLFIPKTLFEEMCNAPRYKISLPLEERIKYTVKTYPHWIENVNDLKETVSGLRKVYGNKVISEWFRLADSGQWEEFVRSMLLQHYDPSYNNSQKKNQHVSEESVTEWFIPDLSDKTVQELISNLVTSR